MIEGTKTHLNLMVSKKNNLKKGAGGDSFGSHGTRYWQIFCHRNANMVSAKEAVRFDSKK
jgi:hypothetical protein